MKLKILHIVYSGVGGTGSVATSIIDGDKKKEFIHQLIFSGKDKTFNGYKQWCKKNSIRYFQLDNIKNFLIRDFMIYKNIKKINPKIIIFHMDNFLLTILLNFFNRFNLIYVEHCPLKYRKIRHYLLSYLIFIFFDKIIYLYEGYKSHILKKSKILNYLKKKISIIPNGILLNNNALKIKAKIFRIGMISRYSFGKKQILLVDTIYKIKRENPSLKIKLELIGNGENFKIIKKKIKQNNLQNEIILTESLPEQNLKKWFSNIDLYCHLSVDEGLSTAILHALSNKTLLLVTKNDGNKFLKNHAFFTKNNLSDVSQKIIYICNNMHLFNKRIDKAFKFLQKKYSSNVMFESYKKEFIKLCAKKN